MAGRARDLMRIEELLTKPMLLKEERSELYETAFKRQVDVRRQRLARLCRQRWLMQDDLDELTALGQALQVEVQTVRHDLEDAA